MSSSGSNYADPNLDLGVLEATPRRKARVLDMASKLASLDYYIELVAKLDQAKSSNQVAALEEELSVTLTYEDIGSIRQLVSARILGTQRGNLEGASGKRGVRKYGIGVTQVDCEIATNNPYRDKSNRPAPISSDQASRTYPFADCTLASGAGSEVQTPGMAEAATGVSMTTLPRRCRSERTLT